MERKHDDHNHNGGGNTDDVIYNNHYNRREIKILLDQCKSVSFPPFKRKLFLNSMSLTAEDIPIKDLCGDDNSSSSSRCLGNTLHKLSLSGNQKLGIGGGIPSKLVYKSLPILKSLDLSHCELRNLPSLWDLPSLIKLNVSYNQLTEFLNQKMLEGLPELQELNMQDNRITDIVLSSKRHNNNNKKNNSIISTNLRINKKRKNHVLRKLKILNLCNNSISILPNHLDTFESLQTLLVKNNLLQRISLNVVCGFAELQVLDVSSNPVVEPPIETCLRGLFHMKRYYHCLQMEEKAKIKASSICQRDDIIKKHKRKNNNNDRQFFPFSLRNVLSKNRLYQHSA